MSEGTVQIPVGRRRIIKRPRLTRLLDDANARLVLLVAPAGYGKTTLARQWLAEGRRQHAWYTATVPSADVSALALGLARVLETIVPGPAERMRQRLLAVPASEEEPEVVAEILADSASAWPDDAWLVVDDYHHIGVSDNADRFFARFALISGIRLLLTSRTHPAWASARHTTYGEVAVVGTSELALTPNESALVLGVKRDESLAALLEATQGWPVVTGLAAVTGNSVVSDAPSIEALYDFLAEEVFSAASSETRTLLCRLAFLTCAGNLDDCEAFVSKANDRRWGTQAVVLCALANLIAELARGASASQEARTVIEAVTSTGWIDPLIMACRACPTILPSLVSDPSFAPTIYGALERSRDYALLRHVETGAPRPVSRGARLSDREDEVLGLLCHGLSNKDIGRALFISDVTVKVHLRHIYRKLGVRTRLEAVARAGPALDDDTVTR